MASIITHETKATNKGRPVKRYEVRWREQTKHCSESYPTLKEAQARKEDVERALRLHRDPSAQRAAADRTLDDYARDYFEGIHGTMSADTIAKYRDIYRVYIAPTLGSRPVGSIRVADVKKLRAELSSPRPRRSFITRGTTKNAQPPTPPTAPAVCKEPQLVTLSSGTIKHALGVLRRVLDVAVENEAITSNPAALRLTRTSTKVQETSSDVTPATDRPPTPDPFKPLPLSASQIAAVADWITQEKHAPTNALAVVFSAYTGVRRAELQGLEIRDVTLSTHPGTAGSIRVQRTKKRQSGQWITGTPKSARSTRTVPLDAWLADDLRTYLNTHPNAHDPQAPLFVSPSDPNQAQPQAPAQAQLQPIAVANVYKRYFQPALRALDLPPARWHDLRHSFAVMMLSADVHYMMVSKWLGHSKFSVTLDIYGDYINEDISAPAGLARPQAQKMEAAKVVPIDRASG